MTKNNKIIYLVAGIIFFLVRLTGDLLLHSLDLASGRAAEFWYLITTALIFISFGIYYLKDVAYKSNVGSDNSGDNFLNSTYQTFVLSLIVVLLVIFFSFKDTSALFKRSYIGLILADFFFIYTVIVTLINFQFTYKWLLFRRHRLTRFYLFLISVAVLITISNEIATVLLQDSFKSWIKNISTVIFILIYLLGFLANKKTAWVASLPRNQRTKIFWIILLNIIIVIKLLIEAGSENSLVFGNYNDVYPLTLSLLSISFALYGVFLFRIFMSILAVMPSSVIVERKSSEINTLTYLNKIVAESANNDKRDFFNTVTNLALQASSGYGAWTEIYSENNTRVSACVNISPEELVEVYKTCKLDKFLLSINKPTLIETVRDIKELKHIQKIVPNAKSLIVIPLSTSVQREGTLVIFDSEDYGLEQDDLSILVAFGDNVKIALENSRLLYESVEKERYRSEMMLARDMQSKLLPQKILQPENYTIAAFSLPAMEVGGDYYDVVKLKNKDYCILIGDVSGKGISAAFYMAQLKGVVLSKSGEASTARELLCSINSALYKNMEPNMFITMSGISFSDSGNTISLSRAGHMPFLLKVKNDVYEYVPKGIGIGLVNDKIFNKNIEDVIIELNNGDALILFTDGLNEMRNAEGKELGIEIMKEKIATLDFGNSIDFINEIKDLINNYVGNEKPHDDLTVLIIMKN